MLIKCKHCDNYFEDTKPECPICGAVNDQVVRTANGVPQTIEELKQFCESHNYPLDKMRFFIGIDYREPKAFGIYKDVVSGDFVVYKNKANGERAIRYKGIDEAYAVNELYQKIKEEVIKQKEFQARKRASENNTYYKTKYASEDFLKAFQKSKSSKVLKFIPFVFLSSFFPIFLSIVFIIISVVTTAINGRHNGYYKYNGNYYYNYQGDWYEYDDKNDWISTTVPDELESYMDEYFQKKSYENNPDYSNFFNSDIYESYHSSDSSSWYDDDDDWSSSWDSDWDSSYTDWDSDW